MKIKKFNFQAAIIFEDDDYFVLNKPPFISTLADRASDQNLLTMARSYYPEAQACHRLDKETSGALVFSKHPTAYRHLNMQFEHRVVHKVYHAVIDGLHNFSQKEVSAPIHKLSDGSVRIQAGGKDAYTVFNSIKAFKNYTLVECIPLTGRMHQIRIHLAAINAPITGDVLYGGKPFYLSSIKRGFNLKKWTEEEPLMKRFALHALKLEFKSLKGLDLEIEATYPPDFAALIKQLEKASR